MNEFLEDSALIQRQSECIREMAVERDAAKEERHGWWQRCKDMQRERDAALRELGELRRQLTCEQRIEVYVRRLAEPRTSQPAVTVDELVLIVEYDTTQLQGGDTLELSVPTVDALDPKKHYRLELRFFEADE